MYVRRVVLENIRGFERLDFSFALADGRHAGWYLAFGPNGSGKTTLLQAIALALVGPEAGRLLAPNLAAWTSPEAVPGTISVEIQPGPEDEFRGLATQDAPFWAEVELVRERNGRVSLAVADKFRKRARGPAHGPWDEAARGWFAAGYGALRRLDGSTNEADLLASSGGRASRFVTLFRPDAALAEATRWLATLHHRRLENRPQESALFAAVCQLLDEDPFGVGCRLDRIDSDGLRLIDAKGRKLTWHGLGEVQRTGYAVLVDLLRQLAEAYGGAGLLTQAGGRTVSPYAGVVLADEARGDLLPVGHVQLWLRERFPNCQFLVTATQPTAYPEPADGRVFRLPGPTDDAAPFALSAEEQATVCRRTANAEESLPAVAGKRRFAPRAPAKSKPKPESTEYLQQAFFEFGKE